MRKPPPSPCIEVGRHVIYRVQILFVSCGVCSAQAMRSPPVCPLKAQGPSPVRGAISPLALLRAPAVTSGFLGGFLEIAARAR
ncbi:MAG: hypothetical protein J3K34DRAFT_85624 [Monoraphidium minutum]|nr:MAG: hypothetical protein J3K34DRAFT_85624 [Monoraphidium minutum]